MELAADTLTVRFDLEGRPAQPLAALDAVSLRFPPGTRAVVWGGAGSGKTTLLKSLAGLVRPTSGQVTWDARDAFALSVGERRSAQAAFGMIFQTDALFDSMSVLDNVRLPLRRRGVPETEATARALEALQRVGLVAAAKKSPEQLSGGMRKRAGVARAIVSRPQVLLADDPFAGLDPETEASIAALLLEVSQGRTLIAAAPDPPGCLALERAIRLDGGRVVPPPVERAVRLDAGHVVPPSPG